MFDRKAFSSVRRIVVKVGSSLVTDQGRGLDLAQIDSWAAQLAWLRQQGVDVVLVSSGAVAEGMARLGMSERPHALNIQQAAAAVGQAGLAQAYESAFQAHQLRTAQVLLTHEDLSDRQRYLNARSTLQALLALDVIPIINENDTVAVDEIRFGDNDTLAAMVANLLAVELLVILTDQPGMYNKDPRSHADAVLIEQAAAGDPTMEAMASGGGVGRLGSGGMVTKVRAANRAARSGTVSVIASGAQPDILKKIFSGEQQGTLIYPDKAPLDARKQWLATRLPVMTGRLIVDKGARDVVEAQGRSLLAVGVVEVAGEFCRGDMVICMDIAGVEVARGLVNYSADEARKIMGQTSDKIEKILGYVDESELIHRDNLVVMG
ncbi:Glutamate 5-kinase / RNA-binding C-terminal domain PUA [hydrothermal vent metagenome]|uniref:Glutamate 5-kinase / RNA-binding C-terminal domain PUA n=1 Tax=hydrothermal vent metagenome TaxID=652676 RepID=A0A3B0ZEI3_9ZZZZ